MTRELTQREADAVAVLRAAMEQVQGPNRTMTREGLEAYRAKLLRVLRRGKRKGARK